VGGDGEATLVQADPKDCRSEAWIRPTTSPASNPFIALLATPHLKTVEYQHI
jgi:hypothetical protein